jgi:ATP-dependent RNA helicase DDX3X
MRENVRLCNYHVPTPIQCYTIPAVLQGYDVVACAQTGLSSPHCIRNDMTY